MQIIFLFWDNWVHSWLFENRIPLKPVLGASEGSQTTLPYIKRLKKQSLWFLMTDSICHSSLPRTVLEKVTLTTIQFRIHPRTKVDPMFQCVYNSTPLKSCPYKSSATCVIYGESRWENPPEYICEQQRRRSAAGWSAPLLFAVARFFDEEASHILKWRTEWYLEFISFS